MNKEKLRKVLSLYIEITSDIAQIGVGINIRAVALRLEGACNQFIEAFAEEEIKIEEKTNREVIQIAQGQTRPTALCRDGSIWRMGVNGEWDELPKIPNVPESPTKFKGENNG